MLQSLILFRNKHPLDRRKFTNKKNQFLALVQKKNNPSFGEFNGDTLDSVPLQPPAPSINKSSYGLNKIKMIGGKIYNLKIHYCVMLIQNFSIIPILVLIHHQLMPSPGLQRNTGRFQHLEAVMVKQPFIKEDKMTTHGVILFHGQLINKA